MSKQRITSECVQCGQAIQRAEDNAWEAADSGTSGCSYETDGRTQWTEHCPVSDVWISPTELRLRPVYRPVTVTLSEDSVSGVLIARAVGEIQAWSASRSTRQCVAAATALAMTADGQERDSFTSEQSAGHALAQYLLFERSTASM